MKYATEHRRHNLPQFDGAHLEDREVVPNEGLHDLKKYVPVSTMNDVRIRLSWIERERRENVEIKMEIDVTLHPLSYIPPSDRLQGIVREQISVLDVHHCLMNYFGDSLSRSLVSRLSLSLCV